MECVIFYRHLKKTIPSVVLLTLLCLPHISYAYNADSYYDETTNTHIIWESDQIRKNNGLNVEEIDISDRRDIVRTLKKELEHYAGNAIAPLKNIYITKRLSHHGANVGGLASGTSIYLTGQKGRVLRTTFHHEIAHYLYARFGFAGRLQRNWKSINPPGFSYYGSGLSAIRNKASRKELGGGRNYEEGFVTAYARTSAKEDIAEVASKMFTGGSDFWRKVSRYKRLEKKVNMLIDYYHSIDSKFTESYFRRIRQ